MAACKSGADFSRFMYWQLVNPLCMMVQSYHHQQSSKIKYFKAVIRAVKHFYLLPFLDLFVLFFPVFFLDYRYRKDEIFKRLKVTTFAQLVSFSIYFLVILSSNSFYLVWYVLLQTDTFFLSTFTFSSLAVFFFLVEVSKISILVFHTRYFR